MPSPNSRSGNPAKRASSTSRSRETSAARAVKATEEQIANHAADDDSQYGKRTWGAGQPTEFTVDLEVPSGDVCKCRRPGIQGLIAAGVLHNIDALTGLVDQKHLSRVKGKPEIDVASLSIDDKSLVNIMHTLDRVVCYVVVAPEVKMTPNDVTNRKAGKHVYCDQIPMDDKLFIFNYVVGGTRDLEQFRNETSAAAGGVDNEQGAAQDSG